MIILGSKFYISVILRAVSSVYILKEDNYD